MTEEQWLTAKTIQDLDLWRTANKRFRKHRLFAAACCQRAVTLVADKRLDLIVVAAEDFADEQLSWDQIKKVRKTLAAIRREFATDRFGPKESLGDAVEALTEATDREPGGSFGAHTKAKFAFGASARHSIDFNEMERRWQLEESVQILLAFDIFGNPFRPVAFDPNWQTSTAVGIARTMYDARDFGAMPILADALQDAGCEDDAILNHCRDAKQVHVRGCWVVDLVLGKS